MLVPSLCLPFLQRCLKHSLLKTVGSIHDSLSNRKRFECLAAAAAAKSLQSCTTLCDTIDGSPPGSPVPGILQARTLDWVAISFSNASKWKGKMKVKSLSRIWLLVTPWTAAYQAPPPMGFSRQEYWSGVAIAFSYWNIIIAVNYVLFFTLLYHPLYHGKISFSHLLETLILVALWQVCLLVFMPLRRHDLYWLWG